MLTTLGMLLIAIAVIAVFLVPDWTRRRGGRAQRPLRRRRRRRVRRRARGRARRRRRGHARRGARARRAPRPMPSPSSPPSCAAPVRRSSCCGASGCSRAARPASGRARCWRSPMRSAWPRRRRRAARNPVVRQRPRPARGGRAAERRARPARRRPRGRRARRAGIAAGLADGELSALYLMHCDPLRRPRRTRALWHGGAGGARAA